MTHAPLSPCDPAPASVLLRRRAIRGDSLWTRIATVVSGRKSATTALGIFVACELVALPLILFLGRNQWFFLDEWDFLAGRNGGSLGDLLRPYNDHWMTLPILAYRAMWRMFGLRSYAPYQGLTIVLHLCVAALLRAIMRRVGVRPWTATLVAMLFVFLGSGDQNILLAFSIGMVGAVAFVLVQLLLADHDGPLTRRDFAGVAAGLAALMCSGVAVPLVLAVALATFVRRGARIALVHTLPLAVVFSAWWFGIDRRQDRTISLNSSLSLVARFVTNGVVATLEGVGQSRLVAALIVLIVVVGIGSIWRGADSRRRMLAIPIAMLMSGVLLLVVTAVGRAGIFGPSSGRASRYVYLFAAAGLPALAVAVDQVARRWRIVTPALLVVWLIALVGNIGSFAGEYTMNARYQHRYRQTMLAVPRVEAAKHVPRSVHPDIQGARAVTLGWLLDGVSSGRIPSPGRIDPATRANATLNISLQQSTKAVASRDCTALRKPITRTLHAGDSLGIGGGPLAAKYDLPGGGLLVKSVVFYPRAGRSLDVFFGPLPVRLRSADPGRPAIICG
jgi:hypothetical protein